MGVARLPGDLIAIEPQMQDLFLRFALRGATVELALEGKAVLPNGKVLPGSCYLRGNRNKDDFSYDRLLDLESGARW